MLCVFCYCHLHSDKEEFSYIWIPFFGRWQQTVDWCNSPLMIAIISKCRRKKHHFLSHFILYENRFSKHSQSVYQYHVINVISATTQMLFSIDCSLAHILLLFYFCGMFAFRSYFLLYLYCYCCMKFMTLIDLKCDHTHQPKKRSCHNEFSHPPPRNAKILFKMTMYQNNKPWICFIHKFLNGWHSQKCFNRKEIAFYLYLSFKKKDQVKTIIKSI